MTTKSICPRAHGEGSIGKDGKPWGDVRTLALNGAAVAAGGVGSETDLGLLKAATPAAVSGGTQTDAAITPYALMQGEHPYRIDEAHQCPTGFKRIAVSLWLLNNGGTLQHKFQDQLGSSSPVFTNPVQSPSVNYVNTPTVGAGTDFAGGFGWYGTDTGILDLPSLGGLYSSVQLAVSVGFVSGASPAPGGVGLTWSTLNINGVSQPYIMLRFQHPSGGAWAPLSYLSASSGYITVNIMGYLPKQN